jgi:hypothetical protein
MPSMGAHACRRDSDAARYQPDGSIATSTSLGFAEAPSPIGASPRPVSLLLELSAAVTLAATSGPSTSRRFRLPASTLLLMRYDR